MPQTVEEETMIRTQEIEGLLILGVGLLLAIFIKGGKKNDMGYKSNNK